MEETLSSHSPQEAETTLRKSAPRINAQKDTELELYLRDACSASTETDLWSSARSALIRKTETYVYKRAHPKRDYLMPIVQAEQRRLKAKALTMAQLPAQAIGTREVVRKQVTRRSVFCVAPLSVPQQKRKSVMPRNAKSPLLDSSEGSSKRKHVEAASHGRLLVTPRTMARVVTGKAPRTLDQMLETLASVLSSHFRFEWGVLHPTKGTKTAKEIAAERRIYINMFLRKAQRPQYDLTVDDRTVRSLYNGFSALSLGQDLLSLEVFRVHMQRFSNVASTLFTKQSRAMVSFEDFMSRMYPRATYNAAAIHDEDRDPLLEYLETPSGKQFAHAAEATFRQYATPIQESKAGTRRASRWSEVETVTPQLSLELTPLAPTDQPKREKDELLLTPSKKEDVKRVSFSTGPDKDARSLSVDGPPAMLGPHLATGLTATTAQQRQPSVSDLPIPQSTDESDQASTVPQQTYLGATFEGMRCMCPPVVFNDDEVASILEKYDDDKDGCLNLDEFTRLMLDVLNLTAPAIIEAANTEARNAKVHTPV